jgi:hypothetical protein
MADPRLETDPDFILLKRYDYSLNKLLEKFPNGVPDEVAGSALGCSAEEIEEIYQGIVGRIKKGVEKAGLKRRRSASRKA